MASKEQEHDPTRKPKQILEEPPHVLSLTLQVIIKEDCDVPYSTAAAQSAGHYLILCTPLIGPPHPPNVGTTS